MLNSNSRRRAEKRRERRFFTFFLLVFAIIAAFTVWFIFYSGIYSLKELYRTFPFLESVISINTFDKVGYDTEGYDTEGYDTEGYDTEGSYQENSEEEVPDTVRHVSENSESENSELKISAAGEAEPTGRKTFMDLENGPIPESPADFPQLQQLNPDVYAWIYLADSDINYPVLQSEPQDMDKYRYTTVDGYEGLPGSIYSQSLYNSKDFSDMVTILYGHNMSDGSMFGGLTDFSDAEYRESHSEIYVFLPDKTLSYRLVFAITYEEKLIPYYYNCNIPLEYEQFISSIEEKRILGNWLEEPFEISTQDHLLILSTCEEGNDPYLVGFVLTDTEYN